MQSFLLQFCQIKNYNDANKGIKVNWQIDENILDSFISFHYHFFIGLIQVAYKGKLKLIIEPTLKINQTRLKHLQIGSANKGSKNLLV
jgi:hypothetical protein